MATRKVWVQLYYEGEEESVGNPTRVDVADDDAIVDALKNAVKQHRSNALSHCDAAELNVYAAGTAVPVPEESEPLDPGDLVPSTTRSKEPLIVVAPPPPQQQHQPNDTQPDLRPVIDFAIQAMENRTEHRAMSDASVSFAKALLSGFGVTCVVKPVIRERGSQADPPPYSWTVVTSENKIWKKGEHAGTPGARDWVETHLLQANDPLGLKVVQNASLPKIRASQRSTLGKGDLAIGVLEDMNAVEDEPYLFAKGLIELKTNEDQLKTAQNMLELMALSTASSFEKGVALLATDCDKKWNVFYFSDAVTIQRNVYIHGRKALEDFMKLIRTTEERAQTLVATPALGTHYEEQDTDGFDLPDRDQKKMKATEDHAMLERLADYLGDMYGERPVVPFWARAEARCPDYYV